MSTSADQTCEVKVDGAWRTVSLKEARLLPRDVTKRCPDCHGQVSIQGTYGMQPRLTLSPPIARRLFLKPAALSRRADAPSGAGRVDRARPGQIAAGMAVSRVPSTFRRGFGSCGARFGVRSGIKGAPADQSSGPGASDEADLLNGLGACEWLIAFVAATI